MVITDAMPPLFLKQLAWMAVIWAASVLALGIVAELIRLWLH
jgi:Protein of unknown function (DUF2474)